MKKKKTNPKTKTKRKKKKQDSKIVAFGEHIIDLMSKSRDRFFIITTVSKGTEKCHGYIALSATQIQRERF